MSMIINVFVTNEASHSECLTLLHGFNLPFSLEIHTVAQHHSGALNYDQGRFFYLGEDGLKINFDWISQWRYHKKANYSLKSEPLAKAVGRAKNPRPKVIDLTCGTGKDSLLLLIFGCEVRAYERNPVVYLLLKDALRLASESDESMALVLKDSFHLEFGAFSKENFNCAQWTLYYDPMYPKVPEKRKALPRKEMVVFHEVVGVDEDSYSFMEELFNSGSKRVVLKRPIKEEVFKSPSASFKGKSTRYDMYIIS
ncbi:class I SAM-dependent methyltransferase [Bacteriovorax sp. BSW11_IV]|uniref:class I SAM-dependent methyltransferase n=1 Tax=Bacteriovorax sp. BSW11_IV TaxID=1353529 RepID=UPI0018C8FB66|nr:class I SAM-dependent methyltransferase [Bacteriovorax sp. BSW11_IV]